MQILVLLCFCIHGFTASINKESGGYFVYCPCEGNLGQQIQNLLSAISYAKGLERTLVLPQFVERTWTKENKLATILHPYDEFFELSIKEYTHIITMDHFVRYIAPRYWLPKYRTGNLF